MKLSSLLLFIGISILYQQDGTEALRQGARFMFNGRPKEWKSSAGKEIEAYGGYWTLDECKSRCEARQGCQEFRIKKSPSVKYSGCVLMRAGTHYSGAHSKSFEMYKLTPCTASPNNAVKLFDGRPKEWKTSAGKELVAYGDYWTLEQCKSRCEARPGCQEFRIKKNSGVSYSGCVLMRGGTHKSGQFTTSFEMYKLVPTESCATFMFNGRPKEWRTSAGKEIKAYGGYWSLNKCKAKCAATKGCQDFRIKKSPSVKYSGCVLMRAGTHYSGAHSKDFEMYKLRPCT